MFKHIRKNKIYYISGVLTILSNIVLLITKLLSVSTILKIDLWAILTLFISISILIKKRRQETLIISALIIILIQLKWYLKFFIYNSPIILLLLPLIIIFYVVWVSAKDKQPVTKSSLLTCVSITLAILFFLFQDNKNIQNKLHAAIEINAYNCSIIERVLKLENNLDENFALNLFILDELKTDNSFLYESIKVKSVDTKLKNLQNMEAVNSLVKITQIEPDPKNRRAHNEQIVRLTKKLKEEMCYKDPTAKNGWSEKISNNLIPWAYLDQK